MTGDPRLRVGPLTGAIAIAIVGCVGVSGAPAARLPPLAAADWSTVRVGDGSVAVRVINESEQQLWLRVRDRDGTILAQTSLPPRGRGMLHLPSGELQISLRLVEPAGGVRYYRGPPLDIPWNATSGELSLTSASLSNLHAITEQEFAR